MDHDSSKGYGWQGFASDTNEQCWSVVSYCADRGMGYTLPSGILAWDEEQARSLSAGICEERATKSQAERPLARRVASRFAPLRWTASL